MQMCRQKRPKIIKPNNQWQQKRKPKKKKTKQTKSNNFSEVYSFACVCWWGYYISCHKYHVAMGHNSPFYMYIAWNQFILNLNPLSQDESYFWANYSLVSVYFVVLYDYKFPSLICFPIYESCILLRVTIRAIGHLLCLCE